MNSATGIPTWDNYYNYLTFNPTLIIVLIVIILLYFILFGLYTTSIAAGYGQLGHISLAKKCQ